MSAVSQLGQIKALAVANARFWPTVAPIAWRELARWRENAAAIEDPELRALALAKLDTEAFNAEVAATLATLAPRVARAGAVRASVALEVLFDYLDGRSELIAASDAGLAASETAFEALTAAVCEDGARDEVFGGGGDGQYLSALAACVREQAAGLRSFALARPVALAAGRRCAQAQSRLHEAAARGQDAQLAEWARTACEGSGLEWREYLGGSASSVLAMHALIATAATPGLDQDAALATDAAYLAIGALVTLLDSVADEDEDETRGEPGYVRLFSDARELEERAVALAREALARAALTGAPEHHAMTLAGIVAYYTSHPGVQSEEQRALASSVRHELGPAIWPTLAVMRAWRLAKAARARARAATLQIDSRGEPADQRRTQS